MLRAISYFRIKAPIYIFNRVLNMLLTTSLFNIVLLLVKGQKHLTILAKNVYHRYFRESKTCFSYVPTTKIKFCFLSFFFFFEWMNEWMNFVVRCLYSLTMKLEQSSYSTRSCLEFPLEILVLETKKLSYI